MYLIAVVIFIIIMAIVVLFSIIKIIGPFDLSGAFYSSKPLHIILYYYYEYDSIVPKFMLANTTTNNVIVAEIVGNVIKNNKISRLSVVCI